MRRSLLRRSLPVLFFFAVLGVSLGVFFLRDTLAPLAHHVTVPLLERRESLLSVAYVAFESVTTKESLVRENKELHEELSRLRRENFQTKILAEENKKLKTMLGRKPHEHILLASVLGGPSASLYDTLLIDAGSIAGVSQGSLVRVSGGVAIGTVAEVYEESSLVSLFSAYGEEFPVILGNATTTHVTALGQGGGMFLISVPRALDVLEGDPIRIPSLSGELVASVEAVEKDSSGAFSKVYFRTPVNLSSVRFVEIVGGTALRKE